MWILFSGLAYAAMRRAYKGRVSVALVFFIKYACYAHHDAMRRALRCKLEMQLSFFGGFDKPHGGKCPVLFHTVVDGLD